MVHIANPRTIMQWLWVYRRDACFPNLSTARVKYWHNKRPAMFSNNPDLYDSFITFANANLSTLSGESIRVYLFQTAFPKIVRCIRIERKLCDYSVKWLMLDNNVPVLDLRTIYNWMKKLGFTYD
jgi:hypothetical protein